MEQSVNLDKLIPRVGLQQMNLWLAQVALEEAQERIRELEAQLAHTNGVGTTEIPAAT